MGWPSTVNFSKDRRVVPALPRPAGAVWAISHAGRIAGPATAPIITNRFIAVSSLALAADKFNGLNTFQVSARRGNLLVPRRQLDQHVAGCGQRESDRRDRRDDVTHRPIMSSEHASVNHFARIRY